MKTQPNRELRAWAKTLPMAGAVPFGDGRKARDDVPRSAPAPRPTRLGCCQSGGTLPPAPLFTAGCAFQPRVPDVSTLFPLSSLPPETPRGLPPGWSLANPQCSFHPRISAFSANYRFSLTAVPNRGTTIPGLSVRIPPCRDCLRFVIAQPNPGIAHFTRVYRGFLLFIGFQRTPPSLPRRHSERFVTFASDRGLVRKIS